MNERISAQLSQQRTFVPVLAEVVHSPVSSPDGPLPPPPAAARADMGTGLRDDEDLSSDKVGSPPCPSLRNVGCLTTGLDASLSDSPVFDYGADDDFDDDFPTDEEVSKFSFFQRLIHYMDRAMND